MKKIILLFILLFAFKSYSCNLALEMMKLSAINSKNLSSNESQLTNQMILMMMQQEALEARERELFQKFQYEKELQRESRQYQNQLEIIRQKNKKIQEEKIKAKERERKQLRKEKMHKGIEKALFPLYKKQAQLLKIQKIIDLLNLENMPETLDKINKIYEMNGFQKYLLTLFDRKYNKKINNPIESIALQVKIIVEFKKKWYGYFMPDFTESDYLNLIILMDEYLSNEYLSPTIILFNGYDSSVRYFKELQSKEEKKLYKEFIRTKLQLGYVYSEIKDDFENSILQHEINFIIQ